MSRERVEITVVEPFVHHRSFSPIDESLARDAVLEVVAKPERERLARNHGRLLLCPRLRLF